MLKLEQVLDELAIQACSQLTPPCGARPALTSELDDAAELLAVIGFSGERLRGVLGLIASREALTLTDPLGKDANEDQQEDWLGELANQLLGRIKAGLLARGLTVWMTTPVVLRGISVRLVASRGELRHYVASAEGTSFTFWLDVKSDEPVLLTPPAPSPDGMGPGDVVLF